MNPKLSGIVSKPHLFIETQFSSEEQSDRISHFNNFQFEPKDAVLQIGNYNNYHGHTSQDEIMENQIDDNQNYNNIIQGLVHLEQIMKSWEINAFFDCFQIVKSLDSPSLRSFYYDRSSHKELLPNKSVINLRNNNHLLNQHHQRKITSSSSNQRSLQRAQVLNQIITKLHSRDKSLKGSQSYRSNTSHKSVSQKQIVKGKLQKLSNMLKGYKMQNEQSIKQSAVLYTKDYNKTNKLQQSKMLDSGYTSKIQMSVFKKLKNEIMQVKSQVKQLKQINEVYRRQNHYLRNDRMSQEHGRIEKKQFQNLSTDREIKYNTFNGAKKHYQGTYLQHNYSQPYFINPPTLISNPYVIPHTSYQGPSTQFIQRNYPFQHYDKIQNSYSSRTHRCNDARHQNDWRTMIPQNLINSSEANQIRVEPVLYCFKCGCKCASNNERLNITQRKNKISSPLHNLNNLF